MRSRRVVRKSDMHRLLDALSEREIKPVCIEERADGSVRVWLTSPANDDDAAPREDPAERARWEEVWG